MAETVEVHSGGGFDSSGDPIADGPTVTLTPLEVAPGNTAAILNDEGGLDIADFTAYFALRARVSGGFVATDTLIRDDDVITVRGHTCQARVQKWSSGGRGGVVVLCKSATGAS